MPPNSTNLLSITNSKGRQVNLLNDDDDDTSTIDPQPTKRRYHCTESGCQKSFTTSGHLARHHRIHTGEKNFHCIYPGCPSRFSRQDNMMQHYRTHMSSRSRNHHYLHHYHQQHQQQQQILHCHSYFGSENNKLYSLRQHHRQATSPSTSRRGWSFSSASSSSTTTSINNHYYHSSWSTPIHTITALDDYSSKPHSHHESPPQPLPSQDWIHSSNKYSSSSYYYNEFA